MSYGSYGVSELASTFMPYAVITDWNFKTPSMWLICPPPHPLRRLEYGASCHVCYRVPTVLNGFFWYLAQMITTSKGCVACNNSWPWQISPRSFNHAIAIKLLKCGIICHIRSVTSAVLDWFISYMAQKITSMRGYVTYNNLCLWHMSSKSFNHEFSMNTIKYCSSCLVHSITSVVPFTNMD